MIGATGASLDGVTISGGNADGVNPNNQGGGMYNDVSSPTLTNVTISGNSASWCGGGIHNYSSSNPQIRNSIVWGNSVPQIFNDTSTPAVSTSIVEGGYAGTGNLSTDPLFVSAVPSAPSTGGDLRLQVGSPAINTGDSSLVPGGVTTDLAGNARIDGSAVDMGAYEYMPIVVNSTADAVDAGPGNGVCQTATPGE